MPERFVVIGGDAAGMSAAARLKRRRPELEIEVFEMGEHVSYGACGIPYFISGAIRAVEDLVVVSAEEFIQKRGIMVRLRHEVEQIVPDQKLVVVRDQERGETREAPYDQLLISTGAGPIIPPELDMSLPGVFALRGLSGAAALKRFIVEQRPKSALIIGAGYIGMEMAEALTVAGLQVTLVEFMERVIPAMEEELSAVAMKVLTAQGVSVLTKSRVERLTKRPDGKIGATLGSGEEIFVDLVLVAIGVAPRSELAKKAGIELGVKNAIKVNRRQQTSAPGVWAAGDCAEAYHLLLEKNAYIPLALTANRQGRIVAENLAGNSVEFPGIVGTAVFKLFDHTLARTGLGVQEAKTHGLEVVKTVVTSRSRAHYYPGGSEILVVLLTDPKRKKLWGAQMAGKEGVAQRINTFAACLAAGLSVPQIFNLDLAYAPPFSPVWDPVLQACEVAMK